MGKQYEPGSERTGLIGAFFTVVAGTRWLIIVAIGLAVLVALIFGGLWQAAVVTLLGFAVPHYLTRWREIEADERQRRRELEANERQRKLEAEAHERQRERDLKSQEEQRKLEIVAAQRQQKIVVYNTFANAIYDTILTPIQLNLLAGKPPMPDMTQFTEGIMAVSKGMTMWGSDEVLKYYDGFVQRVLDPNDKTDLFDEFAHLFLLLRKDVGYDNEGIGGRELRRMFGMKVDAASGSQNASATGAR